MPASKVRIAERLDIITRAAFLEGFKTHPSYNDLQPAPACDADQILALYDPLHRGKKSSSGGSGRSSNDPSLAEKDTPYDESLCCKRVWNSGLGGQCQHAPIDDSIFCTRCEKEFAKKGDMPFGLYNKERPTHDLTNTKHKLPWADLKAAVSVQSKLKVSDIREKLDEMGLDTTGKKAELLERLNAAISGEPVNPKPAEEVLIKSLKKKKMMVKKSPKKMVKKVVEPKPAEDRMAEVIVGANGQAINMDLGPVDNGTGVGFPQGEEDNGQDMEAPAPVEMEAVKKKDTEKKEDDGWANDTEELSDGEDEEPAPVEIAAPAPVEIAAPAPVEIAAPAPVEIAAPAPVEIAAPAKFLASVSGRHIPAPVEIESPEVSDNEVTDDEDAEFDTDDFEEIDVDGIDYLYDENSGQVHNMQGTVVGNWDETDGIIWEDNAIGAQAEKDHMEMSA
jgi:hypothetical protein